MNADSVGFRMRDRSRGCGVGRVSMDATVVGKKQMETNGHTCDNGEVRDSDFTDRVGASTIVRILISYMSDEKS